MTNQDPHIAQELLSHQAFLRRLAIDLVGKDADDLVQDVWQRALEHPPHHGHQLRGWLARVARNLAANRWRSDARRTEREERRAREQPAGDEIEARFELRKDLVGALDSLSQPCRETILLRYFEGLAPSEIATRQGTPVATVKTRLRRGLEQLRGTLDKRCDGDRDAWMSAVSALAAPVGGGVVTGTFVIGGIAMGTILKVSAAVLVAATCVHFVTRTPRAVEPPIVAVAPPATDVELAGAALVPAAEERATEAGGRSPVAEQSPVGVAARAGTHVLRVTLEGITQEDARMTTVTLTGVDKRRNDWPDEIRDSWPALGLKSNFDLDPFFASVEQHENLRATELEVEVDHPHHLRERTRVPVSHGVELANGKTVYEVRVRLVRPVFWPEFTLNVRDANTRAHLEDVELRCVPTSYMGRWQRPGTGDPFTLLGGGLSSPIGLLGGREADEPEDWVAGIALRPAAGEAPQLLELAQPEAIDRGVMLYARAPGYAWGQLVLDVSKGAKRELLLRPATALGVHLANVQLERYAALETKATLCVLRHDTQGGEHRVWFQQLDETLETEGLRLEALEPGKYVVSVELGGTYSDRKVFALQEVSLAAGEERELVLALPDSPVPPARATLGGVVSFPGFGGEEKVSLQFYEAGTNWHAATHVGLSLADLERVGGALPTWSFRAEDLPVGLYQIQLWPFLKSWMIELPAGGREDVKLVIPELAEVLVETVDARTGERIPLDVIRYSYQQDLPGQVRHDHWARAEFEGEPGRFRFWSAPGAAFVKTLGFPNGLDYGRLQRKDLQLVPGLQAVRFELSPVYAIRFEFREGGAALPRDDGVYAEVRQGIHAVDHEGRVTFPSGRLAELSAPGVYEISFEGVGADRFLPVLPRRVDVRAGQTTEVIVELRRK